MKENSCTAWLETLLQDFENHKSHFAKQALETWLILDMQYLNNHEHCISWIVLRNH